MDSGTTGNRNLVPSVCKGSRFAGLGDGQYFMEKLQDSLSLMDFIATFFSLCQKNFASIFVKTEFWQKFGWKIKILCFQNDFWVLFIASSGAHINFPNCQIPLDFSSIVIPISIGEQARNWARGSKTQNFKVLRFERNFRGRSNMTSEGTPWPHTIKKHPTNLFIHDSSEKHVFPPILSLSLLGSSKFS